MLILWYKWHYSLCRPLSDMMKPFSSLCLILTFFELFIPPVWLHQKTQSSFVSSLVWPFIYSFRWIHFNWTEQRMDLYIEYAIQIMAYSRRNSVDKFRFLIIFDICGVCIPFSIEEISLAKQLRLFRKFFIFKKKKPLTVSELYCVFTTHMVTPDLCIR